MTARDSKYFALDCSRCGATGKAYWSENDGYAYLRNPDERNHLSFGFTRVRPDPPHLTDEMSYVGRVICSTCGRNAEITPINGTEFHSIKVTGMREV